MLFFKLLSFNPIEKFLLLLLLLLFECLRLSACVLRFDRLYPILQLLLLLLLLLNFFKIWFLLAIGEKLLLMLVFVCLKLLLFNLLSLLIFELLILLALLFSKILTSSSVKNGS